MFDRKTKSFAFGALLVLATSSIACGGAPEHTDPTSVSSQELTVEVESNDRVVGFFEREGVFPIFDFYRESADNAATNPRPDRSPLFDAAPVDNVNTR